MKLKIVKVPLPNLGARVYVVITKNFKVAAKKIFQDNTADKFRDSVRALCCHRENHHYVFFKPDADAAEIAHEMWHAVHAVFQYIGAELENEVVGYNLEYLVAEAVDILKQWARKIK